MLKQTTSPSIGERVAAVDWNDLHASLDRQGWAVLPALLNHTECEAVSALYAPGDLFRSHVVMARHGFGQGEYRYFAYPLPPLVEQLRTELYPRLAPIANALHKRMGMDGAFPADHSAFLGRCHAAGQARPTPLLLKYGPGDYNCLHQDLYGEHVFPLQAAVLLSQPDRAAPSDAVASFGGAARQGRCRSVRGHCAPASRHARRLSGEASTRSE
jgi:uncharacterized protein